MTDETSRVEMAKTFQVAAAGNAEKKPKEESSGEARQRTTEERGNEEEPGVRKVAKTDG